MQPVNIIFASFSHIIFYMKKILTFSSLLALLGWCYPALSQNFNMTLRSEMSFPGQTVANIWGYTDDQNREYALVGGSSGTIIVEVTDPDNPQQITQIPGPNSLWKEIRSYGHYAYIATEGGGGIQIVDLSALPSAALTYHSVTAGGLNTIHALHVDETQGFLYLYGSNLANGGALVLDLNDDPYNPTIAGSYSGAYVHDGFVDNDTLYAGQINNGNMAVIDFTDKSNPVVLAVQQTPGNFTHNTWLTDDRHYVLTTDEVSNSYLTCYDISDLGNIEETDRLQTAPGSGAIVHNTEIRGNFAITAWYTEGLNIVDVSRPANLVEVAKYDTYAGSGGGFEGCWGAYPYFPSGNIVAGNIDPGKIYVLTPTYVQACYLEGIVTDAVSGNPVNNVSISIAGGAPLSATQTNPSGLFATGQAVAGDFTVSFSRAGYATQEIEVSLANGEVTYLEVALEPLGTYSMEGLVTDSETGAGIPNAKVLVQGSIDQFELVTNASGQFSINNVLSDTYSIFAAAWGWHAAGQENVVLQAPLSVTLELDKGYQDDFILDLGWTVSGTATDGHWERGEPMGFSFNGFPLAPEYDVATDIGDQCYVTGNQGVSFDDDDLDGETILTSPVMDFSGMEDVKLTWFTHFISGNELGPSQNDTLKVLVDNGTTVVQVAIRLNDDPFSWKMDTVRLAGLIDFTDAMRIIFRAKDLPDPGAFLSIMECGVDAFLAEGFPATVSNPPIGDGTYRIEAFPNPAAGYFTLRFSGFEGPCTLEVFDASGRHFETHKAIPVEASAVLGGDWVPGVYTVRATAADGTRQSVRLIRI